MTTDKRLTTKELALKAIETLPDDATLDEIIEEVTVFTTVRERLDRIDSEPVHSHEDVKRRMAEWRR